ncbi:MAG: YihY/virulence factor BrkB family protein [Glaciihabitans sp.]|nr:YihY/virulence factor BrkB family protein [Glaciihabitans sp.]
MSRGTAPARPIPTSRSLPREAWLLAGRRAWHGYQRHRGIDSAASLSFFAALALFPASLSLVSLFALLDARHLATRDILAIVNSVAPVQTAEALRNPIMQLLQIPVPGIALTFGLVVMLWTVSGYLTSFGRAVNAAYDVVEGRGFWKGRIEMLGVAVAVILSLGAIVTLVIGTPTVANAFAETMGIPVEFVAIWNIAKWPLMVGLAIFEVALLYYFTPNVRHLRMRWVSWGAAFSIVVWAAGTVGFTLYLVTVAPYNRVYGWLGGAIALLLWLWITNSVLVFGAEVDAEIVRARHLFAGIEAEEHIPLPVRASARADKLELDREEDIERARQLRRRVESGEKRTTGDS